MEVLAVSTYDFIEVFAESTYDFIAVLAATILLFKVLAAVEDAPVTELTVDTESLNNSVVKIR